MDSRQSYEVFHVGGLMESETETINYKNTSLPPSARLEENRKKEPFSSAAAGSPSVVITGPCSLESAILRFPGWSEHPQTGSSRGSRGMGGPAPLWLPSQGTGPRAVLGDGPSHLKGGSVVRGTQGSAHSAPCWPPILTPHTLLSANLPPATISTQVLSSFPRHDLKATEGQP